MTTKYVAKLNGKIIGKRTTQNRTYSHAIITQVDVEIARKRAYNYERTITDRKNYDYDVEIAAGRAPYEWNNTPEAKAQAAARIEGGFDGYLGRLRARAIENFETMLKQGKFEPRVAAWAGRLDLAHKAVSQHTGDRIHLVAIVPAEVV